MSTKYPIKLITLLAAAVLTTACQSKQETSVPSASTVPSSQKTSSAQVKTSESKSSSESSASTVSASKTASSQAGSSVANSSSSAMTQEKDKREPTSPSSSAIGVATSVSPGAIAGQWKNTKTNSLFKINDDGTFEATDVVATQGIAITSNFAVTGMEQGADGRVTAQVTSPGSGFVIYYYPAGVAMPLQLVTIKDGQTVLTDVADPTDSNRERIFYSNGIQFQVTQEQYDNFLDTVAYRP